MSSCRADASACGCAQPAKPGVVATAESSAQEVSADMVDIMEAYNVALGRYVRLVRDTLPLYSCASCCPTLGDMSARSQSLANSPWPSRAALLCIPLMISTWSLRAPEKCCGLAMPCTPEAVPQYRPIQWSVVML